MMSQRPKRADRLLALFIIGILLLNFPIIGFFSDDGFILGIPTLFFYLFVVWLGLIAVAAIISRRR